MMGSGSWSAALDRASGCLLGLAAGDAMGMPTSFFTPRQIRERFGVVRDFLPAPEDSPFHRGLPAGRVTDDTEQTVCVARAILRARTVEPRSIVQELGQWANRVGGLSSRSIGPSTRAALERLASGASLEEAGRDGTTNGAAMRIAPVAIVHGLQGSPLEAVVRDAWKASFATHGTAPAVAAASAVAAAVAEACSDDATLATVLGAAASGAELGARLGRDVVSPSVSDRIRLACEIAQGAGTAPERAHRLYQLIGTSDAAAESVPASMGILAISEGDPTLAVSLGANIGGDCDTIASIAGAVVGALVGRHRLPSTWERTIETVNCLHLRELAEALVALAEEGADLGRLD